MTTPHSQRMTPRDGHAVVIGGSMAGLLAARVLVNHFTRVTIVERDVFPQAAEARSGVPQSKHLHGLLKRGHQIIEHYLPGFTERIQAQGAHLLDFIQDFQFIVGSGPTPHFPSDIQFVSCSRSLMEWMVRTMVLEYPNITPLAQHEVVGLLAT
jgi:2-polyprenyl-6-methoxyphenol hydroxylase-like FAD-dependent oxidoreductase